MATVPPPGPAPAPPPGPTPAPAAASQEPFERALAKFKMGLKKRDQDKFKNTTLADVKRKIGEIQRQQHASRRLTALNRLQPFLEAMQQFGKAIAIFANTNEIIAYVWGPLKLLLEISSTFVDSFKDLLGVYQDIGERLPNIMRFEKLFQSSRDMRDVLALLYEDILNFHQAALKYFDSPLWKQMWKATWKDHKSTFGDFISDMTRHYHLVESTATVEQIADLQEARKIENKRHEEASREKDLERLYTVTQWLRPASVESDHHSFLKIRSPYQTTGSWLLNHPTFEDWFSPQFAMVPPLLWLSGMPGAGKTILASLVIEKAIELSPRPTVAYFYCKHKDTERDNFRAIARTILSQLLKQDRDLLAHFYEKCCASGEPVLEGRATIESLLKEAFENCKSAYIVIDGLDECSRDDRKEITQWFRSLVEDLPTQEPDRLRCMFISQDDGFARKDFSGLASIKIEPDDNKADIESYCLARSEQLTMQPYYLARERATVIAKTVASSSSGMFLLANLIWRELFDQATTMAGLEEELEPDVFPQDVNTAYDRILSRIKTRASKSRWNDVQLLLGWLVVAKRPLQWHEIQCLKVMAVSLDKSSADFERERFIIGAEDLLDALVHRRDDNTVELVHLSAKYFLVDAGGFDVAAEEFKLATLCLDYMNMATTTSPTMTAAVTGHYGLIDYAALYWIRHLEAGLTGGEENHDSYLETLAESLDIFLQQHFHEPTHPLAISQRNRDKLAWFEDYSYYENFLQAFVSTRKQITFFGKMKKGEIALDISDLVVAIRKVVEEASKSNRADFTEKYGTDIFKCPRLSCLFFTTGFETPTDRDKHADKHDRPFRCTEKACTGYTFGFTTASDLDKHMRETHSKLIQDEQFPTEHEVQQSMQPEPAAPEPEVVPAPAAVEEIVVEVAPAPEPEPEPVEELQPEPVFHPLPAPQRTRRRERQKEFICSHCAKVFQKKYNWTSHLLTHTTDKPFKCSKCDKRFSRQTDMRRHENSHGEKMHVCFGNLQNGGTWGCGKSFARADILKSHHQAKTGEKCIRPLLAEQAREKERQDEMDDLRMALDRVEEEEDDEAQGEGLLPIRPMPAAPMPTAFGPS